MMDVKCIYQYSAILPPIVISTWLVYASLYSPASLSTTFGRTFLFILLPLSILAGLIIITIFGGVSISQILLPFFAAVVGLLIILAGVWFYTTNTFQSLVNSFYLRVIFGILALLLALAIIWPFMSSSIARLASRPNSWLAFFLQVVFYIPCMIRDGIRYLGEQAGMTPPTTFVLLVLEALVLSAFFVIPTIYKSATTKDLVEVIPGAVFLNEMQVVANSDMTFLPVLSTRDLVFSRAKPVIRRNYAWTMWIYINDYDRTLRSDAAPVRVFEYAGGAPAIYYDKTKKAFDLWTTGGEAAVSVRLATQKWIMLTFNYNDNCCDIFIDGELAHSEKMEILPKYSTSDVVKVGEDAGIDGAICNVSYYLKPLTQGQIAGEYNLLHETNPPVWDAKKLKNV